MGLIKMGGMGQKGFGKTLAFVLMVAFGIFEPGSTTTAQEIDRPNPSAPSLERIQQGKALYEGLARCIHCHGQTALRRPLTRQELFSIIKFGVPGTSHMPFRYLLSDEQIWAIVEFQCHGIGLNGCRN
ncbi:MAG: cytochrome c [Nitrospirales bacterium]|nr:cytochrome c [Nitrospirales bacterium]